MACTSRSSAMEMNTDYASSSSKETEILDVKPLRSLSPMFPASLGSNKFFPPPVQPFVFITPHGSYTCSTEVKFPSGFCSLYPTTTFGSRDLLERSVESSLGKHKHDVSGLDGNERSVESSLGKHKHDANGLDGNERSVEPSLGKHKHDANGVEGEDNNENCSLQQANISPPPFQSQPETSLSLNYDKDPLPCGVTSNFDIKIEQPVPLRSCPMICFETEGGDVKKPPRKRPKKTQDSELSIVSYSSYEARESVEVVLMTFDALRRRLMQLEEAKNLPKRSMSKAGTVMMDNDLRANKFKRIGYVPGIEIGDLFYWRIEMCLVGLHAQSVGGIDYMTARFGDEDDPVAVAVVSAGGYENEDEDVDVLVYSGQGGSSKNDKKRSDDQKLERGNLAMERSLHRANEIRVIRTVKDGSSSNGKIYIYDGLYKINKSWVEKAKSGFNVFKYKLVREPGQPDGIATWKAIEKWKKDPSSRSNVILSDMTSGAEKLPVCLVNDVDDTKGPNHFTYVTKLHYPSSFISKPAHGCTCLVVCLPDDPICPCAQHNGGELPYALNGILVSHKPLIYECGTSCKCTLSCRNRVTQKGITHSFEVFRTKGRGWGLRSWDPIRAGAFICEYTGEVIDEVKVDEDGEDEYIFQPIHSNEEALNWNYIPELLGEPSHPNSNEGMKPLQIIISAKSMGNIARFMNHSCSPNVFWQAIQHDHSDEGYPHIMFFAIRHIPPMTELTFDYGPIGTESSKEMETGKGPRRVKNCLCGSPKCRGLFI